MPIASGNIFGVLNTFAALEIPWQEICDAAHSFRFASHGKERLAEPQIGHVLRQAETQTRIVGFGVQGRLAECDHVTQLICTQRLGWIRLVIIEEFNGAP